ncbi:MAG: AsmA family protein [Planctomycetota bacterium]
MRKLVKFILGLAALAALLVFVVAPLVFSTGAGREKLAAALSKALDRDVTIADLDVGLFWSPVEISGLRIANPAGYPDGALLDAEYLKMESSLRKLIGGTIRGGLTGRGVTVHIIKKDGGTNMDGMGGDKREREKEKAGEVPDLDLSLDLSDGTFIIEDLDKPDRLEVGGVRTRARVTNQGGMKTADLEVGIDVIDTTAMKVKNLLLKSRLDGDDLVVPELSAELPGSGRLDGNARMGMRKGGGWSADLTLKQVSLDKDMMPFVGAVYPLAASAGGQVDGLLDARFKVNGTGLTWEKIKPDLTGEAQVTLSNLGLPSGSVVTQLTRLAGGGGDAVTFNSAGAAFAIRDGWLHFNRLSASGKKARYDLAGKVSLDGELKLTLDLLPLVKTFGGGGTYKKVAEYAKSIPVRIEGQATSPKLKAPTEKDLAASVGEKALEKGLEKIFR